jgi:hypothetical protein
VEDSAVRCTAFGLTKFRDYADSDFSALELPRRIETGPSEQRRRQFLLKEIAVMSRTIKCAEKVVVYAAKGAWVIYERLNRISPNPSFTPKWSNKPLPKSYQKEKPPLGWPRTTDSLCPKCVPEIRKQILDGKLPHEVLLNEKVGEIKAQIIERDGKILMVKDCPKHGHFEDVMSIDTASSSTSKRAFPEATSAPITTRSFTTTALRQSPTGAVRCSPSTSRTAAT